MHDVGGDGVINSVQMPGGACILRPVPNFKTTLSSLLGSHAFHCQRKENNYLWLQRKEGLHSSLSDVQRTSKLSYFTHVGLLCVYLGNKEECS